MSQSENEFTVPTEPGWPDDRPKYGSDKEQYRKWWLSNPLSTVWSSKRPDLYERFKREQELIAQGKSPDAAASSGANISLDDLRRRAPWLPTAPPTIDLGVAAATWHRPALPRRPTDGLPAPAPVSPPCPSPGAATHARAPSKL